MNDKFYRAFEEHHRGSRELIKSRLKAYASFIQPLASLYRPATAIDLGCGRGEWLELLGETGFDACGIDLDEGMLAACRERKLNARQADALETLKNLPDDSTALVSAFHVVEHLPFEDVQKLVREALRVLKPGGLLILETPNSENLVVGASEFYKDPSHARPIPWELLRFVAGYAGFERNIVVRLQERAELHAASELRLIDVLGGVSPDYAVVAQKSAAAEVLSAFDQPFGIAYGISLDALAQRYDAQTKGRISETRELLAQIKMQAAQNDQKMHSRVAQMEERLAQTEQRLDAILLSRSWRLTAPVRFAGSRMRMLKSIVLEGMVLRTCKKYLKALLRRAAQTMLRQPHLKKAVIAVLDRVPSLKRRLHGFVLNQGNAPDPALTEMEPQNLSPRAMHIYTELKKKIDEGKS